MNKQTYQICTNCIMDTTDPGISFDAAGVCDYCNNFKENILPSWCTDERGEREVESLAMKIREDGKGKD